MKLRSFSFCLLAIVLGAAVSRAGWGPMWPDVPVGIYRIADPSHTFALVLKPDRSYELTESVPPLSGVTISKSGSIVFSETGRWTYTANRLELTPSPIGNTADKPPADLPAMRKLHRVSDGRSNYFVSEDPRAEFCFALAERYRGPPLGR
jgi:hypothetical protein